VGEVSSVKDILDSFAGLFRKSLENTVERSQHHHHAYEESSSLGNESVSEYRRRQWHADFGAPHNSGSWSAIAMQTPLQTFETIAEGFEKFAAAISELAVSMDEFNKRLGVVESLLTIGDSKQVALEEKVRFIVEEVKRLVDIYIEEELDAHILGRKINWKLRCKRDG